MRRLCCVAQNLKWLRIGTCIVGHYASSHKTLAHLSRWIAVAYCCVAWSIAIRTWSHYSRGYGVGRNDAQFQLKLFRLWLQPELLLRMKSTDRFSFGSCYGSILRGTLKDAQSVLCHMRLFAELSFKIGEIPLILFALISHTCSHYKTPTLKIKSLLFYHLKFRLLLIISLVCLDIWR